ncbi:20965_t:CDS:2, partial [Gigaspora rosea]
KPQLVLPGESNYFETCLKHWQEPCIVSCGSEFMTMDEKKTKKCSCECLQVNIAGINITDEGLYLEYKDLPEEISFLLETQISNK